MPKPTAGESQSHFISRCVKEVMGEGKEQKAALGQCYGTWRSSHGGTAKIFSEVMKQQPSVGAVHVQSAAHRRRQRQQALQQAEDRKKKPGQNGSNGGAGDTGIGTEKWSVPLTIKKADAERQMIFGWASVVAKDGNYIIDKQGDIIPIDELENAVLDYVLHSRDHGVMHSERGTGRLVMSFLTTPDFMKAFDLSQKDNQIGWIAGYKIEDPALWEAHKRGLLPEFSIGGSSVPFEQVDNDDSPLNLAVDKARDRRLARAPFRY
jgi:hypothetical protein